MSVQHVWRETVRSVAFLPFLSLFFYLATRLDGTKGYNHVHFTFYDHDGCCSCGGDRRWCASGHAHARVSSIACANSKAIDALVKDCAEPRFCSSFYFATKA